ncbi:hypothetical protein PAXINDRAFT_122370 [Paxillus involutus ATCC 200175]|uniref:WD40 repeat-like protein n=1 Tax=Paxillus involutus ATCC 200175 TaxID=664439 RepID=A0A0C9TDD9_PAXIN|nr:hypothetical protein PAXINDRAFT_122370 [Paxillus involutus ATCC 200175]
MSNTSKKSVDLTPRPLLTISAHEDLVCGIVYLPGGGRLVTCSQDETVRVWDSESGEQEGVAMEHGGRTYWHRGLAVTRDGQRILSGSSDKVLRVWDVETHQAIAEWVGHDGSILCIAIFSPDGTKLASGHDDGMIRVFDVENGDLILGPIQGHTKHISSVVWSLDGRRLFTASADESVRLWDSETGETIGDPWIGHTNYVNSISLSPDGTRLASVSGDQTVRFWGTESGDPIGEPVQHESILLTVTFSPSGEFVACGGHGGRVCIWRVPWWHSQKEVIAHTRLSCYTVSHCHCDSRRINHCWTCVPLNCSFNAFS